MKKRLLSCLLTLCVTISMLPTTAFALEYDMPTNTTDSKITNTTELESENTTNLESMDDAEVYDDVEIVKPITSIDFIEVNSVSEFKEAVINVNSGGTIKVGQNLKLDSANDIIIFPANKSITLDMNNTTISVSSSFSGRPIKNNGTLTILGNGVIDSSSSEFGGYGAVDNYGTLTIENGTYTGSVYANGASIRNRPGSTLVINNGLFNGATCTLYNEGKATINGGVFETTSCTATTDSNNGKNHWAYAINSLNELYFNNGTVTGVQGALAISKGKAEIKDGTFKTVGCEHSATGDNSHYALYVAGERGAVEAYIYGGTYTSKSKVAVLIGNDNTNGDGGINAKATAHILGGNFVGGNNIAIDAGKNTGNPSITGGTFNSDVSKYVSDGYVHNNNNNGTYTVVALDATNSTAVIGQKYFKTWEDALAAVKPGDTLKLLKNVSVNAGSTSKNMPVIDITYDLTIDGNNKTITVVGENKNDCIFIMASNAAAVTIKDLNVVGDKNVKHGVQAYDKANLTLSNVSIKNFKGTGLTVNGATATATNLSTYGNGWGGVNVGKGTGITTDPKFTFVNGYISETLKIWADNTDGSAPSETYVVAPSDWSVSTIPNTNKLAWDKKVTTDDVTETVDNVIENAKKAEDVLNSSTATEEEKTAAKETINAGVEEAVASIVVIKEDLNTTAKREEIATKVNNLESSFVKANEDKLTIKPEEPTIANGVAESQKIPAKPVEVQGLAVSALSGSVIQENTKVFMQIDQTVAPSEYTGKISLSIKPKIKVGENPSATIENSSLKTPVTFKVYLNNSFESDNAEVVHILSSGNKETFTLPVKNDTNGKFINITVMEFSNFIISPKTNSGGGNNANDSKPSYNVIEGNEQSISNTSKVAKFRFDMPFSNFGGVWVDGSAIAQTNYNAKSGSTIIELNSTYLKTLPKGKHTITIIGKDGSMASAVFYIGIRANPNTGINC